MRVLGFAKVYSVGEDSADLSGGRRPQGTVALSLLWIPAFAGMTVEAGVGWLSRGLG